MNNKKKDTLEIIETMDFKNEDCVLDEILDENKNPYFCRYDLTTKKIAPCESILIRDEIRVKPIFAELITRRVIQLPTEIYLPRINPAELVNEISDFIKKWVEVSPLFNTIAAHYILFSYIFDKFQTLPYLRVRGDMGCGKSRFLFVMNSLLRRSLLVNGVSSAAATFRIISQASPSICFDEMDLKESDTKNDFIKILNCGFSKGQYIMKVRDDINKSVEFFDPYGCKVIATRGQFDDVALESRCFTEIMQSTDKKIAIDLNKSFFTDSINLRNKLLAYRYQNYKLNKDYINHKDLWLDTLNAENRIKQISSPLYYVFWQTNQINKFTEFLNEYEEGLREARKDTKEAIIIDTLFTLISQGDNIISSTDIEAKINNKYYTSRSIGRILSSFGFKTKVNGFLKKRALILDESLLNKLKRKYISTEITTKQKKLKESNIYNYIKDNEGTDLLTILNDKVNGKQTEAKVLSEIDNLKNEKKIETKGMRYYIT